MKHHQYRIDLEWTGNQGAGTTNYLAYSRAHTITATGKKITILGSSDPAFRGDSACYNPEELFLASLASCHMLWFLHLCTVKGVIVAEYTDAPVGTMQEAENGSGQFSDVLLRPHVKVTAPEMLVHIEELHAEANKYCFIANSVNFPVRHSGRAEVNESYV